MVRKTYKIDLKNKAEELRRNGCSYKQIYNRLKIPKSTLSTWFGSKYPGVFDRKKQLEHLARVRLISLKRRKEKKNLEQSELERKVASEIRYYPTRNIGFLKSVLSALYWAEGGKYRGSPVVFTNTDPKLAKLFITLLRKCYSVDEKKLRIRLHLHHYHSEEKSKRFWSRLLDVPLSQFGKIYIKKRSNSRKFRENFMGICFIKYYDNMLQKEIMVLANQLSEKITCPRSSMDRTRLCGSRDAGSIPAGSTTIKLETAEF